MRRPAAALSLAATLALALALPGCRDRAPAAASRPAAAGEPAPAGPRPIARAEIVDAAPEPDGAPIRPADVLEGGAAESAMAASLAPDAGTDAGAPRADVEWVVDSGGIGPLRLGMTSGEVTAALPGVRIVATRVVPGQPTREAATLVENGRVWLQLGLYAGRLVEITVTARTPRALTSDGYGVDSVFEEVVIAHGAPRAVTTPGGALRGWVLEDLPGVLWEAARGVKPVVDEDGREGPPPAARVARLRILGATTLAAED